MIKDSKTRFLFYLILYLFILLRTVLLLADFRNVFGIGPSIALFIVSAMDIVVIAAITEIILLGGDDDKQ